MTIYYLYIKTHNKTGLKYLGQTKQKDPHKYKGSGNRWLNHLSVHGADYTTEILRECQSKDEIKEWGLYYSQLWDVVKSDEWANLVEEKGDCGPDATGRKHSLESRLKMSKIFKEVGQRIETRSRRAEGSRQRWKDPEHRSKVLLSMAKTYQKPEVRARRSEAAKKRWADPEYRAKNSASIKKAKSKGASVPPTGVS